MKNKIIIAFDLDGTLIDLVTSINKHIFDIHGIDITNVNKPNHNYESLTGLSHKELWKIFRIVYKEIETTPIYPGAHELLTKLYEKTNEPPMILTARPFDVADDTYAIIKRMMKKTPFSLILKHPAAHKSQYLNGYDYYVEDRRRTAIELSDLGFIVPLIRKNYNWIPDLENYPGITYFDGVCSLIPHIDDFIF